MFLFISTFTDILTSLPWVQTVNQVSDHQGHIQLDEFPEARDSEAVDVEVAHYVQRGHEVWNPTQTHIHNKITGFFTFS